ncbi:enhancer of polycomb-like protein 2 [Rhinolophus ferrumequinum]|uniref:Enhancer of polycomb-like protein 2 n=1 Tax=Rhinolophus ferrumequinum TaxID=59479 RepID=A0A7J7YHQ5_RHIFE|nr:enhancer of polycomb-like protein 2 [Rhinolophus ferrumequinum]
MALRTMIHMLPFGGEQRKCKLERIVRMMKPLMKRC